MRLLAQQVMTHLEVRRQKRELVESEKRPEIVSANACAGQGKPKQMAGAILSATECRQAEIASLRLAAIVEFSDDAIIGKDLNSIITS